MSLTTDKRNTIYCENEEKIFFFFFYIAEEEKKKHHFPSISKGFSLHTHFLIKLMRKNSNTNILI